MGIFSYVKLGKKIFGKQKTTGETVNPFQRKKMRSDAAAKMGDIKVQLGKLKGGAKKLQTSMDDVRAAMRDKARIKKMGGGMMGRRMGYKGGSKKSSLGMQSVKYGLDNNPNITAADPKAKFIAAANKKKKKV